MRPNAGPVVFLTDVLGSSEWQPQLLCLVTYAAFSVNSASFQDITIDCHVFTLLRRYLELFLPFDFSLFFSPFVFLSISLVPLVDVFVHDVHQLLNVFLSFCFKHLKRSLWSLRILSHNIVNAMSQVILLHYGIWVFGSSSLLDSLQVVVQKVSLFLPAGS